MKWIPNVKKVMLHSYSQHAQMVTLAGIGGYSALPDKMQDALPMWLVLGMAAFLLTLGIVGRLIAQPKVSEPE